MMMVTDYKVVIEMYGDAFNTKCAALVREGWQPRGKMEYIDDRYTQVFVKYE